MAGLKPPLNCRLLSLSRLIRCGELPGQTADDAVLTLISLSLAVTASGQKQKRQLGGQTAPIIKKLVRSNPGGLPKRALPRGTGGSSVDEAAKPDIHHQANRQENKQRGGTAVAHERQRNPGHRHSADDHGHVY